jgi:hypothetical protein
MQGFVSLYIKLYALGLAPFIVATIFMLFIPFNRPFKAAVVSALALVTATPVVVPLGWGAVIVPVSWTATLSSGGIEIMLLNARTFWPLQLCSALGSALLGFAVGYYLLPRSRFNRTRAAPNNSFKPTPRRGAA